MPPISSRYYDDGESNDSNNEKYGEDEPTSVNQMAFWYLMVLIVMLLTWLLMFLCLRIFAIRQKTRNPQQRRMYAGTRPRPSLSTQEPSIYVNPSNLPPPPKYECMAPPSYEEVVGVHYPNLQAQQPITQPIAAALAHSSTSSRTDDLAPRFNDSVPATNDSASSNGVTSSNDTVIKPDTVVVTVNERQIAMSS